MGLALAELRFLAFDRPLSRISHYQRFRIPKKTGGERLISAPMPRLKRAQYWILDNILARVPIHQAAHGFVPGRSILSNAAPHVGRDVVVNFDLKDFFPTLTWKRVRGKFRGLGYSEAVATVLALICTEPDVDEIELDGQRLYAKRGPRRLPQGAPTSPALTNLICLRLDQRLQGLAAKLGFTYTRYADDMTFSASGEPAKKTGALLKFVGEIVTAEGFTVHPDKTRVMRCHRRQEVTGLTVNERIAVPRDTLRRFRALLHGIETTGPEGKRWGRGGNVLLSAAGFARFVQMVDAKAWHVPGGACRYAGRTPRRRTARPAYCSHLPRQGRRRSAAAGELVASRRTSGTSARAGSGGTSGQWHGRGPSGQFHSRDGPAIRALPPARTGIAPRRGTAAATRCQTQPAAASQFDVAAAAGSGGTGRRVACTAGWRHAGGCAGRRNRALSLVAAEGVNGAPQPRHRLIPAAVLQGP